MESEMPLKQRLEMLIQLADQVTNAADTASSEREFSDLKTKATEISDLLRQAAHRSSVLYVRPTLFILGDAHQALALALKFCHRGILRRAITIISSKAVAQKSISRLDYSIGNLSWLLLVSAPTDSISRCQLRPPPVAKNDPILCLIWQQIAILLYGSLDDKSKAAATLISVARDSHGYGKLIIKEEAAGPLVKLLKEGKIDGQKNAALAIGLLGRDPESAKVLLKAGVSQVFAKILKEGHSHMKVQAMVAWAVSEFAAHHPGCGDYFAKHHVVRLLVAHLAFETVGDPSWYPLDSTPRASPVHLQAVVMAAAGFGSNNNIRRLTPNRSPFHPLMSSSPQHSFLKAGEAEDPAAKAMTARALWKLGRGNSAICRSIAESGALLCFAVLLEKGTEEAQYISAMAVLDITVVAEKDPDFRRSAFKPSSPARYAVVEQLLRIIQEHNSDILVPCIKAVGNLARMFRATEARIIGPLVQLLGNHMGVEVHKEALFALTKFAGSDNYLCLDHSKAVISAGGIKHLIHLVRFEDEQMVQSAALMLLSYIALHVPESKEVAQSKVVEVLRWALKQSCLTRDVSRRNLMLEAKRRLEHLHSRYST